jgi:TfoX/Sxy family transcriptional regulator of competence genes
MATATFPELEENLGIATKSLPDVTSKKMFGCHALWVKDNVFALVWKQGRIGFKLPNESQYNALMSSNGAEPWKAGPMKMAHWVLVPESFHCKPAELKKWAARAHELCATLEKPAKTKSKAKKKVAKKVAKKKAG